MSAAAQRLPACAMQFHCLQVAGGGFGVLACLLVGIPEAVERAGFSFGDAEVAEQVE